MKKSKESDKPEFDIMPDGYARGFNTDSLLMRADYRTPAAIRHRAELEGKSEAEIKTLIEQYHNREQAKWRAKMKEKYGTPKDK